MFQFWDKASFYVVVIFVAVGTYHYQGPVLAALSTVALLSAVDI